MRYCLRLTLIYDCLLNIGEEVANVGAANESAGRQKSTLTTGLSRQGVQLHSRHDPISPTARFPIVWCSVLTFLFCPFAVPVSCSVKLLRYPAFRASRLKGYPHRSLPAWDVSLGCLISFVETFYSSVISIPLRIWCEEYAFSLDLCHADAALRLATPPPLANGRDDLLLISSASKFRHFVRSR